MATTPSKLLLGSSFEDFTSAIGLDSSSIDDHEARQGRSRLIQDRNALLPRFRHNPAIRAPFHRTQLDYKAFLKEAKTIYELACPETRARYDLLKDTPSSEDPNAAVKWLLWQALRQGEQHGR